MAIPIVTSQPWGYGQVGLAFQKRITARNQPTSFGVIGTLPDGLSVNLVTGEITGTPTTPIDRDWETIR